jgi:hypothetical protein
MTAEAVGTALLLAAVVGSGIMGERLAGGNVAIALLANTLATGAMLVALILTFGPISGAHFNPAVTLADASQGGLPWREVPGYLAAQVFVAFAGVATAHLMFGQPLFSASRKREGRRRADFQRVRRHIRTAGRFLGLRSPSLRGRAIRGGRLHHRRVLVHGIDFVRQPGCDTRQIGKRYLRRHTFRRCAGIHSGSTGGSSGGDAALSLARAGFQPSRTE